MYMETVNRATTIANRVSKRHPETLLAKTMVVRSKESKYTVDWWTESSYLISVGL